MLDVEYIPLKSPEGTLCGHARLRGGTVEISMRRRLAGEAAVLSESGALTPIAGRMRFSDVAAVVWHEGGAAYCYGFPRGSRLTADGVRRALLKIADAKPSPAADTSAFLPVPQDRAAYAPQGAPRRGVLSPTLSPSPSPSLSPGADAPDSGGAQARDGVRALQSPAPEADGAIRTAAPSLSPTPSPVDRTPKNVAGGDGAANGDPDEASFAALMARAEAVFRALDTPAPRDGAARAQSPFACKRGGDAPEPTPPWAGMRGGRQGAGGAPFSLTHPLSLAAEDAAETGRRVHSRFAVQAASHAGEAPFTEPLRPAEDVFRAGAPRVPFSASAASAWTPPPDRDAHGGGRPLTAAAPQPRPAGEAAPAARDGGAQRAAHAADEAAPVQDVQAAGAAAWSPALSPAPDGNAPSDGTRLYTRERPPAGERGWAAEVDDLLGENGAPARAPRATPSPALSPVPVPNPFPHIFPDARFTLTPREAGVWEVGAETLHGTWRQGRDEMRITAVRGEYSPQPPEHLPGFTRYIRTRQGGYWVRVAEAADTEE